MQTAEMSAETRTSWTALIVGLLESRAHVERDGLVERRAFPEIPPRVEYSLTPLGLTLCEPLAAIRDWAETHIHEIIAARQRYDSTHEAAQR